MKSVFKKQKQLFLLKACLFFIYKLVLNIAGYSLQDFSLAFEAHLVQLNTAIAPITNWLQLFFYLKIIGLCILGRRIVFQNLSASNKRWK